MKPLHDSTTPPGTPDDEGATGPRTAGAASGAASSAGAAAPVIDVRGLRFRYPGAETDALGGLDLSVESAEFVAVVGANGSGKSTLARLLGGLETPAGAMRAVACGHDLLTDDGRMAARREVGVLFQNPENQLVAECVEDDVAFGLENLAWAPERMRARVDEMLARFGLTGLRDREPHLLSGGQKQRTALAGVLAVPRRVLVLDEPTAMLDPAGRGEVLEAVAALRRDGLAVVFVTQEMDEVVGADRVVALERGAVVYAGDVPGLFEDVGLVRRLGLGLPAAGELALELAALGRPLEPLPLTLDALVAALGASG
ncbi:MAG: ATP-binding cassette domain-containing protein [Actinobacteria bacterium]|nr:ATP-binding cassette domain-containing protein [Actinomycetota bacterium]